jgi:hypothetical protein
MRDGKASRQGRRKKERAAAAGRQAVYGDKVSICANAKCVMRKNAKCSGFEGCPGFKGK